MPTEKKLILAQDERAPNSILDFQEAFKDKVRMSFWDFKKLSKFEAIDDGFTVTYSHGYYRVEISADDPIYKLYEILHIHTWLYKVMYDHTVCDVCEECKEIRKYDNR